MTRSPLFDLEEGSHHVWIKHYSQLADDISHLSDPTGLETTPPRSSLKRSITSSTTRPSRIRNPWKYLKRVVQRNPNVTSSIQPQHQQNPLDERNDDHYNNNNHDENHDHDEMEAKSTMLRLPTYVESFRYTNLLLPSPTEMQQESDPLLIFDVSSRSFSPRSPTSNNNNLSYPEQGAVMINPSDETMVVLDDMGKSFHPTIHSKNHGIAVLILYVLLVVASILGMLNVALGLQKVVLGMGTVTFGVYSYHLQCRAGYQRPSDRIT